MYTEYQRDYRGQQPTNLSPSPFLSHHPHPQQRSPRLAGTVEIPEAHQVRQPQNYKAPFPQHPSYSQNSAPHHPISHNPPPADAIKCSSCSSWVYLDKLGDHICGSSQNGPRDGGSRGRTGEASAIGLRVDVQAAGANPYGQSNSSLRSPRFPGYLEPTPPHTPGSSLSRPTSPAHSAHSDQLSQSVSSNSSVSSSMVSGASGASGSRMPFFERYNKLVGSGTGGGNSGGVNMAGVGMRNLDLAARSPRAEEFSANAPTALCPRPIHRSRSPSPNPSSFGPSPPSPTPPHQQQDRFDSSHPPFNRAETSHVPLHQPIRLPPSENPSQGRNTGQQAWADPRAPSPSQPTQMDRNRGSQGFAASPSLSASPSVASLPLKTDPVPTSCSPSAQKASELFRSTSTSSSLHSAESAYIAYDRRDTIKPAQLNPSMNRSPSGREQGGTGSISSLDALEDLLLMAREEAEDDRNHFDRADEKSGKQALLDDFLAPSKVRTLNRGSTELDSWRQEEEDELTSTPRARRMPTSKSVPSLHQHSDSLLASRNRGITPSGSLPSLSTALAGPPTTFDCTTCQKRLKPSQIQKAGDGQLFCRDCYAERYLPKCRKCEKAIEGGAVTSSDGKVLGKYHPACFTCFTCSKSFPSGDFYVFDGRPYCQYDYHHLNGSLCANKSCGTPIEGPCVSLVGEENGGGGRYHPKCFVCSVSTCAIPLLEHHFVVDRLPYCETHSLGSRQPVRSQGVDSSNSASSTSRAKKRQTIITRR
ncbi:hypothetical protein JCM3765_002374 [Sporobolomyces pararoseus]